MNSADHGAIALPPKVRTPKERRDEVVARRRERIGNYFLFAVVPIFFIPIENLILVPLGPALFSVAEIAFLGIFVAALWSGLAVGWNRRFAIVLVLFFLAIAAKYLYNVGYGLEFDRSRAIFSLRIYLPLYTALALLAVQIRPHADLLQKVVISAGIANSLIAIVVYFFYPDILIRAMPGMQNIIEAGRVPNQNLFIFFVLVLFLMRGKNQGVWRTLIFLSLFLAAIANLLSMNRTVAIGAMLLVGGVILAPVRAVPLGIRMRQLAVTLAVGGVVYVTIMSLFASQGHMRDLFVDRFKGAEDEFTISTIVDEGLFEGRLPIYEGYFQLVRQNPLLGPQLGTSYKVYGTMETFTSDVSVVSIFFTFGLPGLFLLSLCLYFLVRLTLQNMKGDGVRASMTSTYRIMIAVIVLMSFNLDLLTRDNALVAIALIGLCRWNQEQSTGKRQTRGPGIANIDDHGRRAR